MNHYLLDALDRNGFDLGTTPSTAGQLGDRPVDGWIVAPMCFTH